MTNEAREYFCKNHLSYDNITIWDLYELIQRINVKLHESRTIMLMMLPLETRGCKRNLIFKDDKLVFAALKVRGTYFDSREAITFNRNGFIGFCGWASSDNTYPIVSAFKEWVDWMTKRKKEFTWENSL